MIFELNTSARKGSHISSADADAECTPIAESAQDSSRNAIVIVKPHPMATLKRKRIPNISCSNLVVGIFAFPKPRMVLDGLAWSHIKQAMPQELVRSTDRRDA